jgi:hypothetical protein
VSMVLGWFVRSCVRSGWVRACMGYGVRACVRSVVTPSTPTWLWGGVDGFYFYVWIEEQGCQAARRSASDLFLCY